MVIWLKDFITLVEKAVKLGKELTKIPKLATQQYRLCAEDLYFIYKSIMDGVEMTVLWLDYFLYFNFDTPNAGTEFLNLIGKYKAKRQANAFQEAAYHCHRIDEIYQVNIEEGIKFWYPDDDERSDEVKLIFYDLSKSDWAVREMINTIVTEIDKYTDNVMDYLNTQSGTIEDLASIKVEHKEFVKKFEAYTKNLKENTHKLFNLVTDYRKLAYGLEKSKN